MDGLERLPNIKMNTRIILIIWFTGAGILSGNSPLPASLDCTFRVHNGDGVSMIGSENNCLYQNAVNSYILLGTIEPFAKLRGDTLKGHL